MICGGSARPGAETTIGFRLDGLVPPFANPFGPPVTNTLLLGMDCLEWALDFADDNGFDEEEVFVSYSQDDFDLDGVNDSSLCSVSTGCPRGLIDVSQVVSVAGNPFKAFTLVPEDLYGEDPDCFDIADSVLMLPLTRK